MTTPEATLHCGAHRGDRHSVQFAAEGYRDDFDVAQVLKLSANCPPASPPLCSTIAAQSIVSIGLQRAAAQSREEPMRVYPKQALSGMLVACLCFLTAAMLMPRTGNAQDAELTKSMAALKDRTAKLGDPKIQGNAAVGGKDVPALFFGSTKMNNNVAVVDEVAKTGGKGVAATLFVKDGDQFVRVATTVAKPDKSGRAIGTALDPGPALDALKTGKAYNGEVSVLDKPYVAGYEPIADSSGQIIGAYFVGRKK